MHQQMKSINMKTILFLTLIAIFTGCSLNRNYQTYNETHLVHSLSDRDAQQANTLKSNLFQRITKKNNIVVYFMKSQCDHCTDIDVLYFNKRSKLYYVDSADKLITPTELRKYNVKIDTITFLKIKSEKEKQLINLNNVNSF